MQTTVTLTAGQANQTVYAGWASGEGNTVIIGLDNAFSAGDDGRRMAIWEFDTNSSGVTNADPVHETEPIHPHALTADQLAAVDAANYARTDTDVMFEGTVTMTDVNGQPALHVKGENEVDSEVVIVDGDADEGQQEDIFLVRAVQDPPRRRRAILIPFSSPRAPAKSVSTDTIPRLLLTWMAR